MQKKEFVIRILLVIGMSTGFFSCKTSAQNEGTYIPGGRNIESFRYSHSEGYPPFPDKAQYVGTLRGDWYQMGRQFGEGSGESTRYVSDIWWKTECELWGKAESLRAFELYEAQITAFDPNLVQFMKGFCEGASPWLDLSPYADPDHELHATNYQRVLAANLWDAWTMMHPRMFRVDRAHTEGSGNHLRRIDNA